MTMKRMSSKRFYILRLEKSIYSKRMTTQGLKHLDEVAVSWLR